MKKPALFFCALLLPLCLFAQGNFGLVGHWNFDGNANDVSGNGLNGNNSNAVSTAGFSNQPNTAFYFGGYNTATNTYPYVYVPYNPMMNTTQFSICALVKPTAFNPNTCQGNWIFDRGLSTGSGTARDFMLLEMEDNAYDNSCNIYSPDHSYFVSYPVQTNIPNGAEIYSDPITLNSWYCVVATFDGVDMRLYIDGVLKKTVNRTTVIQPTTQGLTIGLSYDYVVNGVWPFPFTGYIDDIRLYNRAVSASEATTYCDSVKMTPVTNNIPSYTTTDLLLYPNPVPQSAVLTWNINQTCSDICIFDVLGKKMSVTAQYFAEKVILDMHELPRGIYYLKATLNNKSSTIKFIKE